MKIFVGFGFNDRDRWVVDLVFPIIKEGFNDKVITGEELQGDQITNAVMDKIKESDALIGFVTRRGDPYDDGKWLTHRWVTDEISQAMAYGLPVLEVRETGVDDQGGIVGDRQRIIYQEDERDKCLVGIVKTLGKWHRRGKIKLKLLPAGCVEELMPLIRKPDLRCHYTLLVDGETSQEFPSRLFPEGMGGLFIYARNVPREALIQVHIEYQGKHWISNFESADVGVHLRKE